MATEKNANKKCMTPTFRVSFPNVFKPVSYEGNEPKYSVVMLFNKKDADITPIKKAVFNAAVEKWGSKEKWPKGLKMPFRDGDDKSDLQGYEGTTFATATSKQKPGVISKSKEPITEQDGSFYAGCFARATLMAYTYDVKGNKGVALALQNIQKLGDGESFSGRKAAEDEFDSVDDGSDDADNYGDIDLGD